MRSYPSVPNSQYSARQYTNMLCNYPLTHHLIDFSGRTWLVQILRFSLPRNELQTCLSPRCTALLLQLSVRKTLRCRQLLRLSSKSKYSLGSRRLHGRVKSLSEIVRNAWSNRIILRVWSWTSQVVELGNSVWVYVEPWAAVQLRRLVLVRLVVQGKWQLGSAPQLLEVVELELPRGMHLGLPYFRFVSFFIRFKGYRELPVATMSSYLCLR